MLKMIGGKVFRSFIRPLLFSPHLPESWFLGIFNWILRWRRISDRLSLVKSSDLQPRYKIADKDSDRVKYFCFRQQGYASFSQGISSRGDNIGRTYLLQNINFCKNDIVIDCGANTGDLRIFFENRDLNISYIGLEPGLAEFRALTQNYGQSKSCSLHNCALGASNGEAQFFYKPEFGDSSLIENADFDAVHTVTVKTLDTFLEERGLANKRIKLLKLEAEGAEPEVCIGASNSIRNIDFVAADLGFERGVNAESSAPQVINFLGSHGFEVIGITPNRLCVLFTNSTESGLT